MATAKLQNGLIVANYGRHFLVEVITGERLICHSRGKRSQGVVGDLVQWQPSQDEGTIEKIESRRNLFYRQDDVRTKTFAANLDQVLILLAAVAAAPVCFVDTAVLLAADDAHDPDRQSRARTWLQALWQARSGRVSTQVLSEYYAIATRHYQMPAGDARAKLRRYQLWKPWQVDHQTVETAWGVEARFGLAYWDALVVAAAAQCGARYVLSVDLPHLQAIDGVTAFNPFIGTLAEAGFADAQEHA